VVGKVLLNSRIIEDLRLYTFKSIGSMTAFDVGRMYYFNFPTTIYEFDKDLSEKTKMDFDLGFKYEAEHGGFEKLIEIYKTQHGNGQS